MTKLYAKDCTFKIYVGRPSGGFTVEVKRKHSNESCSSVFMLLFSPSYITEVKRLALRDFNEFRKSKVYRTKGAST